jgi:hypothetical protein
MGDRDPEGLQRSKLRRYLDIDLSGRDCTTEQSTNDLSLAQKLALPIDERPDTERIRGAGAASEIYVEPDVELRERMPSQFDTSHICSACDGGGRGDHTTLMCLQNSFADTSRQAEVVGVYYETDGQCVARVHRALPTPRQNPMPYPTCMVAIAAGTSGARSGCSERIASKAPTPPIPKA